MPAEILELMASKFRMLPDATRLAILRVLMRGKRNVSQVVAEPARNQANVSKHLKMLADEGLAARRKEGLQVIYRVDDPLVDWPCRLVCDSIVEELEREADVRDEWLRKLEQP